MDEPTKKLIKTCMIWHHKWIGIGLIFWGIWHYLCNSGLISKTLYWPIILITAGIICLAEIKFLWEKV